MNYIDLILLLIIILFIYNGWRKGFIIGFIDLVSWLGCLLLSLYIFQDVALIIQKFITISEVWLYPLAFLISFIISSILINVIFNYTLKKVPESVHIASVNKLLGTVPGFITGIIYATLLILVFFRLSAFGKLNTDSQKSVVARSLTENASWAENKFSTLFKPLSEKIRNKIIISPTDTKLVSLPFKVANPKVRPDLESRMLVMINIERQKVGLKILKADPELRTVARKHSVDMFARGYFSHYTPEAISPFDRIRREKISFLTAGENLALAANLPEAHTGLMNSPGHKANILHKAFGRVGIGIVDGGIYGIMVTQNFRN